MFFLATWDEYSQVYFLLHLNRSYVNFQQLNCCFLLKLLDVSTKNNPHNGGLFLIQNLSIFMTHMWEQDHIADTCCIGKDHHQTVNTNTLTCCWRKTVFQCFYKVCIVMHGFIITSIFFSNLCLESFSLIDWIIQFREAICQLTATDEEFKTVGNVWIVIITACQWRSFRWIFSNERRLTQFGFYGFFKYHGLQFAQTKTWLHLLFQFFLKEFCQELTVI